MQLLVLPTLTEADPRTIVELVTPAGSRLTLRHGTASGLEAVWAHRGTTPNSIAAIPQLTERAWNRVAVTLDLVVGVIALRSSVVPDVGVSSVPSMP